MTRNDLLVDRFFVSLVLNILLLWLLWHWPHLQPQNHKAALTTARERLLKPRTPVDCPACRQKGATSTTHPPAPILVTPWRECKSRRGAPKRIATKGFACPNRACAYFQITAAHIHALVGDSTHGHRERRETLRCQACGTTFSTRRDTPLYRLKTTSHRIAEVLTALAEGLSVSAAVRVFGHRHATITRWLSRAGRHSATLHDRIFRRLHLPHIQCDELRTRLRTRTHALWLWLATDPLTKIIPVLHLGARNQVAAHAVIHQLHERLAPDCLSVFTSDGLNLYFYALTAHFGQWVERVGRRTREWLLRSRTALRAGEETLSGAASGEGHASDALWDTRGAPRRPPRAGSERQAEYCLCRTCEEGRCARAWRRSFGAPGRPCRRRRTSCCTWNGGVGTTTSCGRMSRSGKR
jgi:IS1 family transposase